MIYNLEEMERRDGVGGRGFGTRRHTCEKRQVFREYPTFLRSLLVRQGEVRHRTRQARRSKADAVFKQRRERESKYEYEVWGYVLFVQIVLYKIEMI